MIKFIPKWCIFRDDDGTYWASFKYGITMEMGSTFDEAKHNYLNSKDFHEELQHHRRSRSWRRNGSL